MSWEPCFEFYLTQLDGAVATIVVDLHARPIPTHTHCVVLTASLKHPRADGLRDERELEAMGQLEDALVEKMTSLDALYLGRAVTRGEVRFVFYARGELEQAPTSLSGYALSVKSAQDPAWDTFARVLFPNLLELQHIFNRRLLTQLESSGDVLTAPRVLDHHALFDSERAAMTASAELAALGYSVDAPAKNEDARYSLEFHREDPLADGRVDAVCTEVLGVVTRHGGEYDGWGCPIVRAG
jgi:regulator of RNase E activity RraB